MLNPYLKRLIRLDWNTRPPNRYLVRIQESYNKLTRRPICGPSGWSYTNSSSFICRITTLQTTSNPTRRGMVEKLQIAWKKRFARIPGTIQCWVCNDKRLRWTIPSFKKTSAIRSTFDSRRIPQAFLILLEGLLHVIPTSRPTAERVLSAINKGQVSHINITLYAWSIFSGIKMHRSSSLILCPLVQDWRKSTLLLSLVELGPLHHQCQNMTLNAVVYPV